MIDYRQMNLLIKTIKAMKCDRYILLKDRIVGTDKQLITLTETFIDTKIEPMYIEIDKDILKQITDIMKTKSKEELMIATYDKILEYLSIKRISDIDILNLYYNRVLPYMNSPALYETENLRDNENMENMLSLKAADGLGKYYINGDIISIFTGLLPVNKNDKLYIKIYPTEIIGIQIYKFIIDKGFTTLNKYIKYISVNGV